MIKAPPRPRPEVVMADEHLLKRLSAPLAGSDLDEGRTRHSVVQHLGRGGPDADDPDLLWSTGVVTAVDKDSMARLNTSRPVRAMRVHRAGKEPAVIALLPERRYTLGRSDAADIVLDNPKVSRVHGMLRCDDGQWSFRDFGSANGTLISTAEEALDALRRGEKGLTGRSVRRLDAGQGLPLEVGDAVLLGTRDAFIEMLDDVPEDTRHVETEQLTLRSDAAQEFDENLDIASRTSLPVFLLGPSGAGKTHAARAIHVRGRIEGPFVPINCARLPVDPVQLQSELLGHIKGAFTGAGSPRKGKFFHADQGTLFLDEVESLPEVAQGFLLDVLEGTGDLSPLGAEPGAVPPSKHPRFRLISSSKVALSRSGLRQDLAERLAEGHLFRVPTLDERREDIPGLIAVFLEELATASSIEAHFSDDALALCQELEWQGQVRELRATVRALVMTAHAARERQGGAKSRITVHKHDVKRRMAERGLAFDGAARGAAASPARAELPREASTVGPKKAREISLDDVQAALDAADGNITHAAQTLGIARNTFLAKMRAFGLRD